MTTGEAEERDGEHHRILTVKNRMGIHARPAAMIVRTTNKYDAEVYVENGRDQVNGKSIMGLMMLAAGPGSKLRFIVIGNRAEELLDELSTIFERRFEEA